MLSKKSRLIRQLRTGDFTAISRAVEGLRERGWLTDGSLIGASLAEADLSGVNLSGASLRRVDLSMADLSNANLPGAILIDANLSGAWLRGTMLRNAEMYLASCEDADLTNATVSVEQLASLKDLRNVTMPDGSQYDGRYNLPGDILLVNPPGEADESAEERWANWYDVSLTAYQNGQDWAHEHLEKLRKKLAQTRIKPERATKTEKLIAAIREAPTTDESLMHLDTVWSQGWVKNGKLRAADFSGAKLKEANFSGADLQGATFEHADLTGADFSEADLAYASFSGAALTAAKF